MRTEHIGPEELLIGVRIEMPGETCLDDVSGIINEIEETLRRDVPAARIIYLEPDIYKKKQGC